MKLVRMRLALMQPILEDPEINDKLQVIYLVRDPRAVINSRRSTVGWCKETSSDCYLPETLCQDMEDDLQSARKLQQLFPGKVHILRYEDMAGDPFNQTEKLLNTLGLDYHHNMKAFLEQHTTQEIDRPWTTSRDSKKRLMYWTEKFSWPGVDEVQQVCASAMSSHGYKLVTTLQNLTLNDVLSPFVESL